MAEKINTDALLSQMDSIEVINRFVPLKPRGFERFMVGSEVQA